MRIRHFGLVALSLAAVAGLTASCGGSSTSAAKNENATVKIGVVLSLTGPDAALGQSQLKAIKLADKQFAATPGPKFSPTVVDEASGEPGMAKLIKSGVAAIAGPTHSSFATAVYSQFDVASIPLLGLSLTVPGLTAFKPYLWRVSLSADRTIPPVVKVAAENAHASTAYVVYANNDLFTLAEKEIFEDTLQTDGIDLLGETGFLTDQRDLSPVLKQIKAADPDIICIASEANDAVRLLKTLRDAGVTKPIVGGNGFNSSAVATEAGAAINNVYVGSSWNASDKQPMSRAFVASFEKAYGTLPDSFAAQAFAGMQVLRDAVALEGPTSADIQDGFQHLQTVQTVLGPFSFDISRDAVTPAIVEKIDNGVTKKIATSPASA